MINIFMGIVVAFFAVTNIVSAQTAQRFERLSLEQGLPQSSVLALIQDHKGFLWFGTQDGLARYDGYTFVVYRKYPPTPYSLKGNWIQTLHEDKQGKLWIGTLDGGLHRFDPVTQRFTAFPYKLRGDSISTTVGVRSMYEDTASSTLWLGTNGAGLLAFDIKTQTFISEYRTNKTNPLSLPGNGVRDFYADSYGNLWIATNNGLCKFNPQSKVFTPCYVTKIKQADRLRRSESNNILRLCEDGRDTLLLGTDNGEVLKFSCTTGRFVSYPQGELLQPYLSGFMVADMYKDSQGTLWFASAGNGLVLMDKSGDITHCMSTSYDLKTLSSNNLKSLYQDRSGIMWVGTNDGGVNKFDPRAQSFTLYQHNDAIPQSLCANNISVLYADHTGTIWIGTDCGLNALNPETGSLVLYQHDKKNPFSLKNNSILAIAEDSLGTLWVSTKGGGLDRFDRTTGRNTSEHNVTGRFTALSYNEKRPEKSVFGQWIRPLSVDRRGALWMGGDYPALQRLDPKTMTVTHNHHSAVLGRRPARVLVEDRIGSWWMGTLGDGLIHFDSATKQYQRYKNNSDNAASIADNIVNALCEDSRGWLWVGTSTGMDVFDSASQTFRHIREVGDANVGTVYAILEDRHGRIWFSDNHGLAVVTIIAGNTINARTFSYTVQRFDLGDGLQSNEFNQNAACKGRDGRLYFGGVGGISAFYPDSIIRNMQAPPVAITEVKTLNPVFSDNRAGSSISKYRVFDTSATEASLLQLSYRENSFTIAFAALDFSNPQKNIYAYKLEGFDQDWIYTSAQERTARYTNLDGGRYTFCVKAANNHGVWNENGVRLSIIIEPPFWRRTWFYTLAIGFIGVFAWLVYRWKLRRELRRVQEFERMREQQSNIIRKKAADDFHDEFGHKLTKIALLSEVMKHTAYGTIGNGSVNGESDSSSLQQLASLNKIIDTAKDLSTGMRDFLWTLNPEKDSLYEIAIRLKDFGDDFFDKTGIAFHVVGVTHELERIRFSMDERRHTTLLFKEAMNNILKHSECHTATFSIVVHENDAIEITLSDDGKGFMLDGYGLNGLKASNGYLLGQGLLSMHERAKRAQGLLKIISTEGQGTTIHFSKK